MLVAAQWCCMWGRGREEAMVLAPLSAEFQSLLLLPTIKLGSSGADSWVGGSVYVLDSCGSLQQTLLRGWEFLLLPPQPPQVFSFRGLRLYFGASRGWGGLFHSPAVPPGLSMCECGAIGSTSHHLVGSASCSLACPVPQSATLLGPPAVPCCESSPPSCLSLPLLPVWMNVSSLSPWLLDFHTVWFSGSSGCFLFLNCCCPSFGCARRHSVSTYASILAGRRFSLLFSNKTLISWTQSQLYGVTWQSTSQ